MTDFRTLERELIEFFDAAGVNISRHDGDVFAVVMSIDCCQPRDCEAQTKSNGVVYCSRCDETQSFNEFATLSITKLAERLAK